MTSKITRSQIKRNQLVLVGIYDIFYLFFDHFLQHFLYVVFSIQNNLTFRGSDFQSFTPITHFRHLRCLHYSSSQDKEQTFLETVTTCFGSVPNVIEPLIQKRVSFLFFSQSFEFRLWDVLPDVTVQKKQLVLTVVDGKDLCSIFLSITLLPLRVHDFIHLCKGGWSW